jgi:hypothetical protein
MVLRLLLNLHPNSSQHMGSWQAYVEYFGYVREEQIDAIDSSL